jgi:hypothetical protein
MAWVHDTDVVVSWTIDDAQDALRVNGIGTPDDYWIAPS